MELLTDHLKTKQKSIYLITFKMQKAIFGKKSKYIIYLHLQPYLRDTYKQICYSIKTREITKHSAGDLSCHMLFWVTHSWDCFANKLKFIHVGQLFSEIAKSLSTLFMPACVPGMLLEVLQNGSLLKSTVLILYRELKEQDELNPV